jgi:DNA modification methylase
MKIENVVISDLKPYPKNSRTHSKAQIALLVKNINRFGFTTPLLIDKDNEIIAGHGRLEAVKVMEWVDVPCVRLENITKEEAKALRIADNQISAMSDWDMDLLNAELLEIDGDLIDLTGFDKPIIPDEKDDVVPEDVPSVTVLGDIYELGNHRVMCGDSTVIDQVEKLMNGKKADMALTDPPYGYSYESNHQKKHKELINDDKILSFIPSILIATENNVPVYIFCGWQTIKEWKEKIQESDLILKNIIIWKKNNWSMGDLKGAYAGQYEMLLFSHKGRIELKSRERDVWEFDRTPPSIHPTMKPVELIEKAILNHESNKVLDLFLGSGSTLIACEKTDRVCYGMELDPHYCDVIVQRYVDFTGNTEIIKNGVEIEWETSKK